MRAIHERWMFPVLEMLLNRGADPNVHHREIIRKTTVDGKVLGYGPQLLPVEDILGKVLPREKLARLKVIVDEKRKSENSSWVGWLWSWVPGVD